VYDLYDLAQLEREMMVKEIKTQILLRFMYSRWDTDGMVCIVMNRNKRNEANKIRGLQQDDEIKKTWEVSPFKNAI